MLVANAISWLHVATLAAYSQIYAHASYHKGGWHGAGWPASPIHLENLRFCGGDMHSFQNSLSRKGIYTYGQNMGVLKKITKIGLQESH